jgi:hypothetical protein
VLSGLVFSTARMMQQSLNRQTAEGVTQGDLRIWVERMVKDIRRAGFDPRESKSFGIVSCTSTELKFTTDSDADGILDSGAPEEVGYRLYDPDADGQGVLQLWQGGSTWRSILPAATLSLDFEFRDGQGSATTVCRNITLVDMVVSSQASTAGLAGLEASVVTESATAKVRNDQG